MIVFFPFCNQCSFSNCHLRFCRNIPIGFTFYLLFLNFMVAFNCPFLHSNDQINLCQIIECKMNKQDHSESFVIEVFVVFKGVHEISVHEDLLLLR
jgi:hypothetical protein